VVKENFGDRTVVHVFEPEDIKTVYSYEGKYPVIPPLMETAGIYREQKGMSLGLGFTNGEEWYRLRSNCQQKLLRPKEVFEHLPGANKVAQDFAKRIKSVQLSNNHEVTDLHTEVGMWNFESSAMIVLDKRIGSLEIDSKAERLLREVVLNNMILFKYSGLLKLSFPFYKYITTLTWKKVVKAEDNIYGYAMKLVDESILMFRQYLESDSNLPEDRYQFLSYLLSREALSLKDITVICLSVLTDGLSTTTPSTLFCLYALATDKRIQDKVYKEIVQVIGDDPSKPITVQDINKMPYLKAFVKETFRLWPNGTEVSRYIENDITLSSYTIPSGTHVDLNPSVHFRNPDHFPEPDKNIPERWLRKDEASEFKDLDLDLDKINKLIDAAEKVHPYILTPFGHGTRMCAGRRFAEMHIYVLLATLLRHFQLDYNVDKRMDAIYYTLLFPDRPLRIEFKPRF
jgi:cytochrome P450